MKSRVFTLCAALALLLSLAACKNASAPEETTLTGRVTAVDGNAITLSVMPGLSTHEGGAPDGRTSGGGTRPSGTRPDGKKPDEGTTGGTPPDTSSPGEGRRPEGETRTITLGDATVVTKQEGEGTTPATAADIAEGGFITATLSGDTVKSVVIGSFGPMGGGGREDGGPPSNNSDGSDSSSAPEKNANP